MINAEHDADSGGIRNVGIECPWGFQSVRARGKGGCVFLSHVAEVGGEIVYAGETAVRLLLHLVHHIRWLSLVDIGCVGGSVQCSRTDAPTAGGRVRGDRIVQCPADVWRDAEFVRLEPFERRVEGVPNVIGRIHIVRVSQNDRGLHIALACIKVRAGGELHVWIAAGVFVRANALDHRHHRTVFLDGTGRVRVVGGRVDCRARRLSGACPAGHIRWERSSGVRAKHYQSAGGCGG